MNKINVTVLPEVNQDLFPKLEMVDNNTFIEIAATPLNKKEREYIAGMFATHAAREGAWRAISITEIGDYLEADFILRPLVGGILEELWVMFKDGLVEILIFEGKDYLYPTEKLGPMITGRFFSH